MPTNTPHLGLEAAKEGGFVHLHLHSEYSLLDGGNRIDRLVARVKELGMSAVAVTDHGNLFGAMSFYRKAKESGIKPILGIEAYVAPGDRRDRTHTGVMDGGFHLVLLAENLTGWRNLLYLSSESFRTGFYYKPRMDREILEKHSQGLIAINGHLGSELAFHMVEFEKTGNRAHWKKAVEVADWHRKVFAPSDRGPRFFVELQHHIPEQGAINPHLIKLAREMDLPIVCDNDAHFLKDDEHDAHDTLICISMGKVKDDPDRLRYPKQLYVKSPREMREQFIDAYGVVGAEACDNTLAIAERCDVDLDAGNHAPAVRVLRPAEPRWFEPGRDGADLTAWFKGFCAEYELRPFDSGGGGDASVSQESVKTECDAALRELSRAGLVWRYGPEVLTGDEFADRRARLERELNILCDKNISAYFLIVWDFVNWARQRGIPALARGSGVGTMVGYVLGLSNACPVKYGLLFERFTDPDRSEYPDIDIDLCQDGRADVINYVREKYGHVAQIITFGTLKARAAVRDVGRVFAMPLPEVDRVAKLIPEQLKMTLDLALEQEPDLKKLYDGDPLVKRVIDTGRVLEGQARHSSVHAAGVIVATRPLHEIVPIYRQPGTDEDVTQWDGPTCESVGLLKMDFLGLRTLSVIERCKGLIRESLPAEAIRAATGVTDPTVDPLDLDRLKFDDQRVFEMFRRADTTGVFQFESGGMRRLLSEMKPDRLEDLIAANALFRPGPMDLIPDYNRRKHGHEAVPKVHEIVDRHTEETYGVMVYQEQVMLIVHELGDIPLRQAYTLIKAISKKKEKTIEQNRAQFIKGATEKGLSEKGANDLFELILKFAGYGFNKSHSTGYATVAYHTAYLKTYFPNQYMAAFLTYESQAQKVEDWIKYKDDCRKTRFVNGKIGVEVKPPDINLSDADFTVVFESDEPRDALHGHVRFGMRALKGAGSRAIEAIVSERKANGPFRSLYDFCERVPSGGSGGAGALNKATIEALVCCGAFDSVHSRDQRGAMVASIDGAVAAGQTLAKDKAAGQCALFGGGGGGGGDDAVGAGQRAEPPLARAAPWDERTTLAKEKETLGFYISSHPLDRHAEELAQFGNADSESIREVPQDGRVIIGGLIKSVRPIVVRNGRSAGQRMAVLTIEDKLATFEAVLFTDAYAKFAESLVTDSIVFLRGKVDHSRGDAQVIADSIIPIERAPERLATALELVLDERVHNGTAGSVMEQAAGVLRSNRPADSDALRVPVHLRVRTADATFVLDLRSLKVSPSRDLTAHLARVLGEDAVRVAGGIPIGAPDPNDQPRYRARAAEPVTA